MQDTANVAAAEQKPIPNQYALLLAEFRACDQYTDRLAFWERHSLCEQLNYLTLDFSPDPQTHYPTPLQEWCDTANALTQCRTWAITKTLPILTLSPFSIDERLQFIEWGLRVRPGMSNAPQSAAQRIEVFTDHYRKLAFFGKHRKADAEAYLTQQRVGANQIVDDSKQHWQNAAVRTMLFDDWRIDEGLLKTYLLAFTQGEKPTLWTSVTLGFYGQSWKVFDTYLFAKSWYEYAVWLENFNPGQPAPQPTPETPADATAPPSKRPKARLFANFTDKLKNGFTQNDLDTVLCKALIKNQQGDTLKFTLYLLHDVINELIRYDYFEAGNRDDDFKALQRYLGLPETTNKEASRGDKDVKSRVIKALGELGVNLNSDQK